METTDSERNAYIRIHSTIEPLQQYSNRSPHGQEQTARVAKQARDTVDVGGIQRLRASWAPNISDLWCDRLKWATYTSILPRRALSTAARRQVERLTVVVAVGSRLKSYQLICSASYRAMATGQPLLPLRPTAEAAVNSGAHMRAPTPAIT